MKSDPINSPFNIIEAISKIGFWFKVKAGARFNPPRLLTGSSTRIPKYSEELKRGPNAEIGPKDFFEMASTFIHVAML